MSLDTVELRNLDLLSPDVKIWRGMHIEWLEDNNLLEPKDLEMLDNPAQSVVKVGGKVGRIVALFVNQTLVGSITAYPMKASIWELQKLAVIPRYKNKGYGTLLLEYAIDYIMSQEKAEHLKGDATTENVVKIQLDTASILRAATSLYQKYGFVVDTAHDFDSSKYETADLYLSRELPRDAYTAYKEDWSMYDVSEM